MKNGTRFIGSLFSRHYYLMGNNECVLVAISCQNGEIYGLTKDNDMGEVGLNY